MTIRGLYSATLFVEDLDRAAGFYVDMLGFEAETRSARARMLRAGEFRLLLHVGGSTPDEQHLHLHLAVEDVDAFHREVCARGARPEALPETKPWGLRSFELRDPSGYLWEFVQEVDVSGTPGSGGVSSRPCRVSMPTSSPTLASTTPTSLASSC